ncbi:unnamed protein product [Microthlaspi erraticum]|uniref:DUF4218 domain-containing protein n=1 Tax=Microthlaspi erraticum TaxID=1685480 RepID=A0A6D2IIQ1_9BRAS|nr:unnamed protein product [Microthlaspi erraticum]
MAEKFLKFVCDCVIDEIDEIWPAQEEDFVDDQEEDFVDDQEEDYVDDQPAQEDSANNSEEKRAFDELLSDANEELYEGSAFSKLSFMLKLYHIKVISRVSDKGMSMIIDLLKEAFKHAKLPDSFYDLKKTISKLGLDYESIHACPNDCMLYWGEDTDHDVCKICETSRWKTKNGESEEGFKKEKKASCKDSTVLSTEATSKERFPGFASEPRNVRLGLATDGFNPYGSMSTKYSIWPVLLFPYNLPPWMAMKQSSMILSMIIPGKQMPGNDIDIYLQPLIKELKELWSDGVQTFDASENKTFSMRAALMWTISDFPGFGNLSGWNTYTGLACPSCNYDATELRLQHGKKNCFMGHRRFLGSDHKFRYDKQHFDGSEELRNPPITPSGSTILQQVESVDVIFGKPTEISKRKRDRAESMREGSSRQQWRKKSIFFELPYWEHSLLRHNLDVMHIEKNVFDNVVLTLLDDKQKSKDNLKARKDLRELGIRSELWPDNNGKYPPASFKLTNSEKDTFLSILKSARLPDGYSSNFSRCIDQKQRKVHGFKSHDCHIIMGHLLPIAIRSISSTHVTSVITELCHFFRDICSKAISNSELVKLQKQIVLTLCHLEMLFPPSFFTVMMHLTVHLTEEIKLGGPIQFRWMYPIERNFSRFKAYVRNRAQPEGSICEQYLADECLTFCSMYLDGIETRFNRTGRVNDIPMSTHTLGSDSAIPVFFPSLGRSIGASQYATLSPIERQQAHRYILICCPFLDRLREKYKEELRRVNTRGRKRRYTIDIDRAVHLHFDRWLRHKVEKNEIDDINDDIRIIAKGPSDRVLKFSSYNVNGYRYRTLDRDGDLKTQNCGVYTSAETVSYSSSRDHNPRAGNVPYYDTRDSRGYKRDGFGHNMVNFSRIIHSGQGEEDEPFVLASQAKMVYYIEDPSELGWNIAVHIQPKDLYDMGLSDISDDLFEDIDISDSCANEELLISDDIQNVQLVRDVLDDDDDMDEFHETHYGEGSESYFQHDEHLENTNFSQFMHTQGRERGKWVVNVIDSERNVTEERLNAQDIWGMENRKVILEFGPYDQPEGGSGGLFGTFLGQLSNDLNKFPITYEDWRKVQSWRKDDVWDYIQTKFDFDASINRKKFIMKSLSQKCKGLKTRLWRSCRRNTPEESMEARPDFIPKEQWQDFVHMQFTERAKKLRDRNINNRSYYKIPHTLGKKSICRKSKEIEKLAHTRTLNTGIDEFSQVFGAERPGSVRCVGLGPTPSTFFKNRPTTTAEKTEVACLRNKVNYLEEELEKLRDVVNMMKSRS